MAPDPATPDFSAAFPDRPITVRPPDTTGLRSSAGLFVMLFGLLAGALWWLGPDLARDWGIGRDVVAVRVASLGEARCQSRLVVFTVCDITFTGAAGAGAASRTLWYFFIDTWDREPIVLLQPRQASEAGPPAITTNLGLAKLYHRTFALALIVALLVLCIVLSIQLLRAGAATRRALQRLSGKRLRPVVVALEGKITIAHKRRRWTYVWNDGGRPERAFVELPSRIDPLFVTPDGKRALALEGPGGGVPLLLDAQLSSLDLSEVEKEAFFESCRGILARQSQQ